MTDLEKMLFIRERILEGKTKGQAWRDYRRHVRLDKLDNDLPPVYRSPKTPYGRFRQIQLCPPDKKRQK